MTVHSDHVSPTGDLNPGEVALPVMPARKEVEIKFRIRDPRALRRKLRESEFRLLTRRMHEMNTLYDLPGQPLRKRGDLLRLRNYGSEWVLTHKAKGKEGRHKTRGEGETKVGNGTKMQAILDRKSTRLHSSHVRIS